MDQAIAIEPKAGDVLVVHKVLTLKLELVVLVPIPTNGQDFACALLDGHHIWQCNTRRLAVLLMLKPHEVQHDMHLQHAVAIILNRRHAVFFSLLLLNVV